MERPLPDINKVEGQTSTSARPCGARGRRGARPGGSPGGRQWTVRGRSTTKWLTTDTEPLNDGPDPLAPPYDVREALDEMGERILGGDNPRTRSATCCGRGWQERRGLDDLMRRVRERQRELRNAGRLDGMLDQARELLDEALEAERGALFPDPSDDARLREAELDALPNDTSRAIRQLFRVRLALPGGAAEVRGAA